MTDQERLDTLAQVIFDAHYEYEMGPYVKRTVYGDEHISFAEIRAAVARGVMHPMATEEYYRVARALLAKFPGLYDRLH